MLLALALVLAGFLTRRMLVPRVLHYLRGQPANRASNPAARRQERVAETSARPAAAQETARGAGAPSSERITDSDRRALDEVLRRKSK